MHCNRGPWWSEPERMMRLQAIKRVASRFTKRHQPPLASIEQHCSRPTARTLPSSILGDGIQRRNISANLLVTCLMDAPSIHQMQTQRSAYAVCLWTMITKVNLNLSFLLHWLSVACRQPKSCRSDSTRNKLNLGLKRQSKLFSRWQLQSPA